MWKVPEFENFVPGREKARNFGIGSWKLTCDQQNLFFEFSLFNKDLMTETQVFVCCLFSQNPQIFRVATQKSQTQHVPRFLSIRAKAELTNKAPVVIRYFHPPIFSTPGENIVWYFHPGVKISLRHLHPPYDIFTPLQIKAIYDRHITYNCWVAVSPHV